MLGKQIYNFDVTSIPLWVQTLFWGIYLVVFAYALRKTLFISPKHKRHADVSKLFMLFFTTFAVFYCLGPDYFRYREWQNVTDINLWEKEKLYLYTVFFCQSLPFDYPYELFRFIIWGGAILMAYCTFRMYRGMLLPGMVLVFLFVSYSCTFCYGRASLAMAVYFFGIALVLRHGGVISRLLGIGIALSSYYFHHEFLIGIAALPCLFIPLERKRSIFLSVSLLIASIVTISYISTHLNIFDTMFGDDDLSSKIEDFSENEQATFRLSTLVKYLNYFYPLYLITKCFWKKKVPRSIAGMYRITFSIILISISFMFVFGLRSVFSYRVLYISMIPLTLLIGYCYYNGFFKKWQFRTIMILALLANSIRFINAV